jgi:hypothetical protein
MNTSTKIGIGVLVVGLGVFAFSKYIKPATNKKSKLPLAYDNSKINPTFKKALGI